MKMASSCAQLSPFELCLICLLRNIDAFFLPDAQGCAVLFIINSLIDLFLVLHSLQIRDTRVGGFGAVIISVFREFTR